MINLQEFSQICRKNKQFKFFIFDKNQKFVCVLDCDTTNVDTNILNKQIDYVLFNDKTSIMVYLQ